MGCCYSEPSTVSTSSVSHLIPTDKPLLSPPLSHPCRLIDFDDESMDMRFVQQYAVTQSIRMGSLQFDHHEFYRRPDPYTMTIITPQILREVEQALVTDLTKGLLSMVLDDGVISSYNAAQFKNSTMKRSRLSPAIIEAALTQIIENLDEHPKLVAALRTGKIGYHDKGAILDDVGVRTFVIQGTSAAVNAT